jgi:type IV pilus assembly protein PilF
MRSWLIGLISILIFTNCQSLGSDPQSALAYLDLGTAQLRRGQKENALANLLKGEKLDSSNKEIQNQLGLAYFVFKKYPLSVKHFRNALSINSDYTETRNNLARSLIEVGKYTEARKELEIVRADLTYKNTSFTDANTGLSYFREGNYKAAAPYFQRALRTTNDSCFVYTMYARCYYELRNYQKAINLFDKAIPLCQKVNFDEAHYYGALSYFKAGARTKGIALMNEAVLLYTNGDYEKKSRETLELMKLNKL